VVLLCANCGWSAEKLMDQQTVDRLEEEIERGREQLVALLEVVTERQERR
jgi:hypothetical protein